MAGNFLEMLNRNPRGWGNAPGPDPEVAWVDDAGNAYGFDGSIVQKGIAPDQPQSWGEIAFGTATAPARLGMALASSLSPYGDDGWQVPPLLSEIGSAVSAPGRAYYEGMSPEEMQSTALNAAGFAMLGGGPALAAERAAGARAVSGELFSNTSKEAGAVGIADALAAIGSRPEPGADLGLNPAPTKAEAMAASLAETHKDNLMRAARQAYQRDLNENATRYFPDWGYDAKIGDTVPPDELLRLREQSGIPMPGQSPIPPIAEALNAAAAASGRSLDILGGAPYKSAYGTLRTPAGNSYKVRVADHKNTSSLHQGPDYNIAPGAMSPEEFISLLPSIFSNNAKAAGLPAIMESLPANLQDELFPAGRFPSGFGVDRVSGNNIDYRVDAWRGDIPGARPGDTTTTGETILPINDFDLPPIDLYEKAALSQVWRDKTKRTGELFSNNSKAAGMPLLGMSQEARLARAREQGFDTNKTWYRGTANDGSDTPRADNIWGSSDPGFPLPR